MFKLVSHSSKLHVPKSHTDSDPIVAVAEAVLASLPLMAGALLLHLFKCAHREFWHLQNEDRAGNSADGYGGHARCKKLPEGNRAQATCEATAVRAASA